MFCAKFPKLALRNFEKSSKRAKKYYFNFWRISSRPKSKDYTLLDLVRKGYIFFLKIRPPQILRDHSRKVHINAISRGREFTYKVYKKLQAPNLEWFEVKSCWMKRPLHFLVVAMISDLQNSYWNQWPHPCEPQILNRFVSSAVCLHFTAI